MDIMLHSIVVERSSLDFNRHVNNLEYIRWMQEAAIKHSSHFGWTPRRYMESGFSWVVGSHYVKYLRPAFEEERLAVVTWVSELGSRVLTRQYWCVNKDSKKILVKAETLWVFVDRTGKPTRIIDELKRDYRVIKDEVRIKDFIEQIR